jgi:hypothetical protein
MSDEKAPETAWVWWGHPDTGDGYAFVRQHEGRERYILASVAEARIAELEGLITALPGGRVALHGLTPQRKP